MKFPHCLLPLVLLVGHLQAAALPDEERLRELLTKADETSFLAGFCDWLAARDAAQIPQLHAFLAASLADAYPSTRHGRSALVLTEQRWSDLDPQGLLESCAAGRSKIPLSMQAQAINTLLKKDLETALKLYHQIPLNEDFGGRCDFYRSLSLIDPARALRFYFETNECDRSFNNPLEITFTNWAKRDFTAAWTAANAVVDEKMRLTCMQILLKHTSSLGIDKTLGLLIKIEEPDIREDVAKNLVYSSSITIPQAVEIARRINTPAVWNALNYALRDAKPAEAARILLEAVPEDQREPVFISWIRWRCQGKLTAEKTKELFAAIPDESLRKKIVAQIQQQTLADMSEDEKLAIEPPQDEQFEALLAGGPAAYHQIQNGDAAVALAGAMFKRFPDRSLPWVLQFDPSRRFSLLRDLSSHMPVEKVPTLTLRFLDSQNQGENDFGILLGNRWLRADPAKAIKTLFSRYPRFFENFRANIPFNQFDNDLKWDAASIGRMLNEIEDPAGRAIVYQEWMIWRMRALPFDKALPEISALNDDKARMRAADTLVYRAIMNPDPTFIDQIIALPPAQSAARNMVLMRFVAETIEDEKYDTGRTYDMIAAIQDEEVLLQTLEKYKWRSPLKPHLEHLCNLLTGKTPGINRDKLLKYFINDIAPANLLMVAKRSEHPIVRKWILERLTEQPAAAATSADYEALLAGLPASHRDPQLENRWLVRKALQDPATHWAETLKRALEDTTLMERVPKIFEAWRKKDAAAAHRAVMALKAEPRFAPFYQKQLLAAADNDQQAMIDEMLSGPHDLQRHLPQILRSQFQSAPRAACFNCLRIPDATLRHQLLRDFLGTWVRKDAPAAMAWAGSLPPGPELAVAIATVLQNNNQLAEDSYQKTISSRSLAEQDRILPTLPYPLRTTLEKNRKLKQETRSTLSALADLDFDTVFAKTRAMPEGETKNLNLLGLLDHALLRKKTELIDSLSRELLATDDAWLAETTAFSLIQALDLTQLEKAIALTHQIRPPHTRLAIARRIIARWSAAEYRPALDAWIRAWPDFQYRHSLAQWYLFEFQRGDKQIPEALLETYQRALQNAPATIARADLASALLDHRTADAHAAAEEIADPALRAAIEAWLQSQTPAKD